MNPREMFFDKIYDMIQRGDDIVIVTPDLAAPSLDKFRRDFPERYISVGVAEQNLISVSAGLALGGKKVVAWGLNPFVVTRAFDQIRNTISMMNIPIVFAGLHTGLSSAVSGPTHVVISDLALIKTCDNIIIYNPSDCKMCNHIFDDVLKFEKPCYLRFDKDITYDFSREIDDIDLGYSEIIRGDNIAILSTGYHVKLCKEIAEELNSDIAVIEVYRFPCNKRKLADQLEKYKHIITVEEHILQGGFGSSVLELIADSNRAIPVKRIGIDIDKGYPDIFGSRDFFEHHFGLDKSAIKETINDILNS